MSNARWLSGDVFARLADIDDGSIDLAVFSPPFWKQRAYLPNDHPLKPFEIGQENSPAEFIDVMLRITAAIKPKLARHGSIAVELADTMAGSGGAGGDYDEGGFRSGQPKWDGSAKGSTRAKVERVHEYGRPIPSFNGRPPQPGTGPDGPLAKSHCMIPEAYRLALAYGINPLTGAPSAAGRWIVRNVVDWCRRNPTPGDDGDKFRRASSDIAVATLNPRRYWDGDAVRVPTTGNPGVSTGKRKGQGVANGDNRPDSMLFRKDDGTRPLYDWWEMSSDPYPGAHYAVWPPEIARRLILSMCPERVCTTCGEPSRRIVETAPSRTTEAARVAHGARTLFRNGAGSHGGHGEREARTLGWTDCGHDTWRRGHVLDPFGGSGTTGAVATGLGRDATLIDLDDRNLDLARNRIGMFLDEPTTGDVA